MLQQCRRRVVPDSKAVEDIARVVVAGNSQVVVEDNLADTALDPQHSSALLELPSQHEITDQLSCKPQYFIPRRATQIFRVETRTLCVMGTAESTEDVA